MKLQRVVVVMAMMLALAACQGREQASITGGYGSGVVTGQVVMAGGAGSPAGVQVSVIGTGQSIVLAADGAFSFAALPATAELAFRRASDGIAASYKLEQASGHVVIELAQTTARKSGGRRRASGTGPIAAEFEGIVRSASAEQLVVFTSHGSEVTFALNAASIVRKGHTQLAAADLPVGTRVHVKATKTNDAYTALLVIVQNENGEDAGDDDSPASREYEGIVRSASATQLVMLDAHQQEVTFVLNAQTDIRKGNTVIAATDIQAGWRVHVKSTASADGATNTATRVIVQNNGGGDDDGDDDEQENEARITGAVTAVGAETLSIGTTTVQTNASTRIRRRNATLKLSDIKVGDTVKVEGRTVAANTILAKSIEVKSE